MEWGVAKVHGNKGLLKYMGGLLKYIGGGPLVLEGITSP